MISGYGANPIFFNKKKKIGRQEIPATIFKESVETYLLFLTKAMNLAIAELEFPDKLKKSEVIPLYKRRIP